MIEGWRGRKWNTEGDAESRQIKRFGLCKRKEQSATFTYAGPQTTCMQGWISILVSSRTPFQGSKEVPYIYGEFQVGSIQLPHRVKATHTVVVKESQIR